MVFLNSDLTSRMLKILHLVPLQKWCPPHGDGVYQRHSDSMLCFIAKVGQTKSDSFLLPQRKAGWTWLLSRVFYLPIKWHTICFYLIWKLARLVSVDKEDSILAPGQLACVSLPSNAFIIDVSKPPFFLYRIHLSSLVEQNNPSFLPLSFVNL